jgi:hypothetical protein
VLAKHFLNSIFLVWFSKPKCDRALFRFVKRHQVSKIVELGLANLTRSERLIRLAQRCSGTNKVRYTGIDLFEARPADWPEMTLKHTHQALARTGASVRLIPGDAYAALSRYANHLGDTQLIVASGSSMMGYDAAWYYIPRMLSTDAGVFLSSHDDPANPPQLRRVLPAEIGRLAESRSAA